MAMGYQENNFSPMGQGQPQQGKNSKRPNFMDQVVEDQPPTMLESVAPGIPAAQMGSSMNAPVNSTMPIGGMAPHVSPVGNQSIPGVPYQQTPTSMGFSPVHAMEGFDFSREQNTGKSAKDAFASLSNNAPPPPIHDKGALGNWFDQYIMPGMNQLGHNVSAANGDKFQFQNWQGKFDVDFGRGAGAPGGALAWQAQDMNAIPRQAPSNQMYSQFQKQLMPQQEQGNMEDILMYLLSQNQELI